VDSRISQQVIEVRHVEGIDFSLACDQ
jgi:hypothetical protein